MDLFHVAIAIEVASEALLSFDDDQIALAEAAGLAVLHLRRKQQQAQGPEADTPQTFSRKPIAAAVPDSTALSRLRQCEKLADN